MHRALSRCYRGFFSSGGPSEYCESWMWGKVNRKKEKGVENGKRG